MDKSSDDSDSEEEILVFADFKDLLDQDTLKPGNLRVVKAIGMDSETPVVQLNNYFFQGEYQNAMGTQLLFEEDAEISEGDQVFDFQPEKPLKYVCKTRKILNMKRIFLHPKEGVSTEEEDSEAVDQNIIHASTVEEALHNFEAYFDENDCDLQVTKLKKPGAILKCQKSVKRPVKSKLLTLKDNSDED